MSPVPYSVPVEVATLPPSGRDYDLTADAGAREAIARALGLESLEALSARLSVRPIAGGAIEVRGRFAADVVQACVVSLAPVPAHLSEDILRRFEEGASGEDEAEGGDPGWVDPEAESADPIVGGIIDLGDIVTEQLALALDPYPRAPGATFRPPEGPAEAEAAQGPFAALAGLKLGKAAARRTDRGAGPAPKGRKPSGNSGR